MDCPQKRSAAWLCAAASLGLSAAAHGGELTVTVTANGAPVRDAVVYAMPTAGPAAPAKPGTTAVVVQQRQQFEPYVLPVQIGTTVEFPNRDTFRHHVYSFSPAKTFELKLYGGGEVNSVTFDREGAVALGCNIHDNMLAYVYVVGTPHFAVSDANGQAALPALPAGTFRIWAWHPDQRGGPTALNEITVTTDGADTMAAELSLRRERRQRRPAAVDENGY